MKKFLEILLIAVFSVIMMTGCLIGFNSCSNDGIGKYFAKDTETESMDISLSVESILNPTLESPADVIAYKIESCEEWKTDSVFRRLSNTKLVNISSVLLEQHSAITKYDVVKEYLNNKKIYDNLPPGSITTYDENVTTKCNKSDPVATMHIVKDEATTITEEPQTRIVNPPANQYVDTIINGKPALIRK